MAWTSTPPRHLILNDVNKQLIKLFNYQHWSSTTYVDSVCICSDLSKDYKVISSSFFLLRKSNKITTNIIQLRKQSKSNVFAPVHREKGNAS